MTGWVNTLFSGEKFDGFSRIFQDPPFVYMNLSPTTQNAIFWASIRSHAEKPDNARQLENMCKPDIHGALVTQWTCTKVMKEQWEKTSVFTHFFKNFENFISVYLNICFHLR